MSRSEGLIKIDGCKGVVISNAVIDSEDSEVAITIKGDDSEVSISNLKSNTKKEILVNGIEKTFNDYK